MKNTLKKRVPKPRYREVVFLGDNGPNASSELETTSSELHWIYLAVLFICGG